MEPSILAVLPNSSDTPILHRINLLANSALLGKSRTPQDEETPQNFLSSQADD